MREFIDILPDWWSGLGSGETRGAGAFLAVVALLVFVRGKARLRLGVLAAAFSIIANEAVWRIGLERFGAPLPAGFPAVEVANGMAAAVCVAGGLGIGGWRSAVSAGLMLWAGLWAIWQAVYGPQDCLGSSAGVALGGCSGVLFARLLVGRFWKREGWWVGQAPQRLGTAAIAGVLALTAWRLQVIAHPENLLVAEEAQYWDWSRRLSFGYFSKPPLTSVLIRFFCDLGGNTEFMVRLGAVLIALALAAVGWVQMREMGMRRRTALLALLLMGIMPLFAAGSVTMTTDTPLMLFWALAALALWKASVKGQVCAWYLCGLSIGLGMQSKYTMAFFLASALGWLAVSEDRRRHFATIHPYAGLAVALLVFSPVVHWNWANDWVTFKHVAADAGVGKGLRFSPKDFGEFFAGQAAVASPLVFFGILWAVGSSLARRKVPARTQFLLWLGLPVFLAYGAKALQDRVQANWPALAYYSLSILAVAHFEAVLRRSRGLGRPSWNFRVLKSAGYGALAVAFAMSYALLTPDALGRAAAAYLPANRGGDWRGLGHAVHRQIQSMPRPARTFIVGREYQTVALLAFYVPGQPRVFIAPDSRRRMNQYDLWPSYGHLHCWDAVFVRTRDRDHLSPRYAYCFEEIGPATSFAVSPGGKRQHLYTIVPVYGFRSELFRPERPEKH